MKKILTLLTVAVFTVPGAFINAQDVTASLDEALSSYKSDNLEDARFALQGALNGINQAIGKEILAILPDEMNGMSKVEEGDNVTGVCSCNRFLTLHNQEALKVCDEFVYTHHYQLK